MRRQFLALQGVAVCLGGLLFGVVTSAPAAASAPNLPNPCSLVTVAQINTALQKSGAHPTMSHSTYSAGTPYESKTCMWKYGSTTATLNIYDKSGGSGGGPTKTTPEPSLGPNGELSQSTSPQYAGTSVSYTRHNHHIGIYVNRNVSGHRWVALGKDAYNRT